MKNAANFENRVDIYMEEMKSIKPVVKVPNKDTALQEAALRMVEAGQAHAIEIGSGTWEVRSGPGEGDYYFPLASRLKQRMMDRFYD